MKHFITILIFACVSQLWSQPTNTLRGIIRHADNPLAGVHIQNLNSKLYTTTDSEGRFSITASVGHTLQLTHVSMLTVFRKVTADDFQFAGIEIEMKEQITELDGVEVSKYQKIDTKELGIIQHEIKKHSYNEKRLYSTNIINANGGFNFINIIEHINGKRKMLKSIIADEKNMQIASYIKENYSDFLKKEFKLTDDEIDILSYYVMERNDFHEMVHEKQDETIRFMLVDAWREYNEMLKKSEKEEQEQP